IFQDAQKRGAWPTNLARHAMRISSGLRLDRKVIVRSPLGPRTVIKGLRRLAERVKRKPKNCSGHPGAAGGDDRRVQINVACSKCRSELFRRGQSSVLDDRSGWHIERARHVT